MRCCMVITRTNVPALVLPSDYDDETAISPTEPTLTQENAARVEIAKGSVSRPLSFIHGLWLLARVRHSVRKDYDESSVKDGGNSDE